MSNVFASPESDSQAEARGLRPLYSSTNVGWTTFLGSTVAGSILVIANAVRSGEKLGQAIGVTAGFNALYLVLAAVLPEQIPGIVYTIAGLFAMRGINTLLFEQAITERLGEGVPFAPWWHGLLVGLGVLAALVGFAIATMMILMTFDPTLEF